MRRSRPGRTHGKPTQSIDIDTRALREELEKSAEQTGRSVEEIERFLVAWRKAYALATLDDSELEEISNMASEAVLTVKQEMVTMWM